MKVRQTGYDEPNDSVRYFIYDETAEKNVTENYHRMGEQLWGHAYGRPRLCYFSIYGAERIEYDFCSRSYNEAELDLIQEKAKAARARLKKKREEIANGKQPTLFDEEN